MFYVNDEPEGKFLYTEAIKLYFVQGFISGKATFPISIPHRDSDVVVFCTKVQQMKKKTVHKVSFYPSTHLPDLQYNLVCTGAMWI